MSEWTPYDEDVEVFFALGAAEYKVGGPDPDSPRVRHWGNRSRQSGVPSGPAWRAPSCGTSGRASDGP